MNSQNSEHHLLSAPKDQGRPYILSTVTEDDLVARKKMGAYFSLTGAFLVFVAVVILSSLRPPFPG
jgi:hypothetical protein